MDENLPEITKRIQFIIDNKFNGNVRKFSLAMGLKSSAKINRLFLKDKRNNEYPTPSSEIILLISNTFGITTDWLFKGSGSDENKVVNNITIDNKKINGERNITDSKDVSINNNEEFLLVIKTQQEQISNLIKMLSNNI